jgi:hypothetical protein
MSFGGSATSQASSTLGIAAGASRRGWRSRRYRLHLNGNLAGLGHAGLQEDSLRTGAGNPIMAAWTAGLRCSAGSGQAQETPARTRHTHRSPTSLGSHRTLPRYLLSAATSGISSSVACARRLVAAAGRRRRRPRPDRRPGRTQRRGPAHRLQPLHPRPRRPPQPADRPRTRTASRTWSVPVRGKPAVKPDRATLQKPAVTPTARRARTPSAIRP